MTKVKTRLSSIAVLLACASLTTGCFTPAGYAAGEHGAAEEHGGVAEEHGEEPGAEHPDAEHADGEKIVEGIVLGTPSRKLQITAPEIVYEAPYDGKPLSSKSLGKGIEIEEFALGSGDVAVGENKVVEFSFKGYSSINANQVMGSRAAPAKMVINESTRNRDPIASAMADAMLGMKPGGKRRVKIPASIIEKDAPPGRPPIGDLMMVVEIVSIADAPVLASAEKYAGEPVASKKLDNGLEIYDYTAGEGRAAKAGDQVVTHYIGQLTDGTEFDSSHSRAEGLTVVLGGGGVIPGFSQGLEGAKVGMLRKVVIPPELGYGAREQGKIPANSTLVFLLQVTSVAEAPEMPPMPPGMGGMRGGTPPPRPPTPKPAEPKPAKPKPAEPGNE
jgi:FKBP-type peptidyl-prolyl cis-trans isomerase